MLTDQEYHLQASQELIRSIVAKHRLYDSLSWFPKFSAFQWRLNEHNGVSNHQPHDCLLKLSFRRRAKKTSKLRVTGLCVGNSPVTDEFPAQRPVTRKIFPFDDVIMERLCNIAWYILIYWDYSRILPTPFSKGFSWKIMFAFDWNFTDNYPHRSSWPYVGIVSGNGLVTSMISTNDGLVYWRIYASLILHDLRLLEKIMPGGKA